MHAKESWLLFVSVTVQTGYCCGSECGSPHTSRPPGPSRLWPLSHWAVHLKCSRHTDTQLLLLIWRRVYCPLRNAARSSTTVISYRHNTNRPRNHRRILKMPFAVKTRSSSHNAPRPTPASVCLTKWRLVSLIDKQQSRMSHWQLNYIHAR